LNIDLKVAVRKSEKFIERFERMAKNSEKNRIEFKSQSIEIMEEFWQKAKEGE